MTNIKNRQSGSINILIIPMILVTLLFFGALGFGLWSYSSRQDYKNNVDEKIAVAVDVGKKETATSKDNEFIEREKQPLKEYKGPTSLGTVSIKYPKTWSAYIDESGGKEGVDAYFHPNFVPGIKTDSSFALRLQVVNSTYATELKRFDSTVKKGTTKARPYKPVNVEGIVGTQLEGELDARETGLMILIPLRDKTIKIWTEADQFKKDLVDNVLANFKFIP